MTIDLTREELRAAVLGVLSGHSTNFVADQIGVARELLRQSLNQFGRWRRSGTVFVLERPDDVGATAAELYACGAIWQQFSGLWVGRRAPTEGRGFGTRCIRGNTVSSAVSDVVSGSPGET